MPKKNDLDARTETFCLGSFKYYLKIIKFYHKKQNFSNILVLLNTCYKYNEVNRMCVYLHFLQKNSYLSIS